MGNQRQISLEEAHSVGMRLGVDWTKITAEQFRQGLEIELEYGHMAQSPMSRLLTL